MITPCPHCSDPYDPAHHPEHPFECPENRQSESYAGAHPPQEPIREQP